MTRKPQHVNNRIEHVKLVNELRGAGIIVKMKAVRTRTGREVPWHGKMVIVGAEYVIAGSVNPLAPSRFETPIVERLVRVVRNPGTWRTLRKLLVEDNRECRLVERASTTALSLVPTGWGNEKTEGPARSARRGGIPLHA